VCCLHVSTLPQLRLLWYTSGPSLAYKVAFGLLCLLFVLASVSLFTLVVYEEISLKYISTFLEYGKEMHFEL
jgi:hypothetical protein